MNPIAAHPQKLVCWARRRFAGGLRLLARRDPLVRFEPHCAAHPSVLALNEHWAVGTNQSVVCHLLLLQLIEMARSATYFVLLAALALVFVSGSDARTLLGSTLGTYGGFCGYQVSSYMNVSSSDPCAVPMFRDGCRTVFRKREWEKSVESTSGSIL